VSVVTGDVRRMHQSRENAGALFQVASQFNLLEMVSQTVTPEAWCHPLPTRPHSRPGLFLLSWRHNLAVCRIVTPLGIHRVEKLAIHARDPAASLWRATC
jgi:hypothetical protein